MNPNKYEPLLTTEFMVKFDLPGTLEEQMENEKNFNDEELLKKLNSPEFKEKIDKATEKFLILILKLVNSIHQFFYIILYNCVIHLNKF